MNQAFSKIWIVVILVLFVGGIFAWQYFRAPEEDAEDKTANLQTYKDAQYGFEIKYPKDWVVEEEYPGWDLKEIKLHTSGEAPWLGIDAGPGSEVLIKISDNTDNKSLNDIGEGMIKILPEGNLCHTEIRKIGQNSGLYYKNCGEQRADVAPGFIFIKGKYIYNFYSVYVELEFIGEGDYYRVKTESDDFNVLFEKIISTIQFTDEAGL